MILYQHTTYRKWVQWFCLLYNYLKVSYFCCTVLGKGVRSIRELGPYRFWHVVQDRVHAPGPDTENTELGNKYFPKRVNIWHPKWNKCGVFGFFSRRFNSIFLEPLWIFFKMKQEGGRFMHVVSTLLPPALKKTWSSKGCVLTVLLKQCLNPQPPNERGQF